MRSGPLVPPEVTINAGGYLHIPLLLHNPGPDSVRIELTAKTPAGWQLVAGEARYTLAPGETRPVQTFFFAPQSISKEGERIGPSTGSWPDRSPCASASTNGPCRNEGVLTG